MGDGVTQVRCVSFNTRATALPKPLNPHDTFDGVSMPRALKPPPEMVIVLAHPTPVAYGLAVS